MSPRSPSHGPWCNHRAFPGKCKCGGKVFYCWCDHGSKYSVDRLGDPWPLHRCQFYSPRLTSREIRHKERLSLEKRLASCQRRREKALDRVRGFSLKMPASSQSIDAKGIITQIIRNVNIYTLLNIPKGSKNWALDLGPLAGRVLTEVTVVVEGANRNGLSEYQFYVPSEEIKWSGFMPGDKMRFKIEPIIIARRPSLWYCSKFWWR